MLSGLVTRRLWVLSKSRPVSSIRVPPIRFPIQHKPLLSQHLPSQRWISSSSSRSERSSRVSPESGSSSGVRSWNNLPVIIGVFVVGLGYYVYHLEQVPETGRWRFMDIGRKFEDRMAKDIHQQVLSEYHGKILPPDHFVTKAVEEIVSRIIESNNLGTLKSHHQDFVPDGDAAWTPGGDEIQSQDGRQKEWQVYVVHDEKTANAFATLGNLVVVFTGLFPITKDEKGLAAVLGHEIGHIVARHSQEAASLTKVFAAISLLLQTIIGLDIVGDVLTDLLLKLPHSRQQETEADIIGLRLASKACFDPRGALEFHTRVATLRGGNFSFEFLQTHPHSERRVMALEELLPEAYAILGASPECAGMVDKMQSFQTTVDSAETWT